MSGAQNPVVNVLRFGFRTQGTVNPPIGGDYPHDPRIAYGVPVRALRFGRRPGLSSGILVTANLGVAAELLSGVTRKAQAPLELQAAMIGKAAAPVELQAAQIGKAPTPVEWIAAVSAKSADNLETTSSLIRKAAATAEILGSLANRLAAPLEALGGVSGRSSSVAEIQSSLIVVTGLAKSPIEIVGAIASTWISRAELMAAAKALGSLPLESGIGARSKFAGVLEILTAVSATPGARAEFVAGVKGQGAASPLETAGASLTRLAIALELLAAAKGRVSSPAEALFGVRGLPAAPMAILGSLSRASGLPAEIVSTLLALTAKALTPFEIGGVIRAGAPAELELFSLALYGHAVQRLMAIAQKTQQLSAIAEAITQLRGVFGVPAFGQDVTIRQGDSRTLVFPIRLPDGTNPTFSSPSCSFVVTKTYDKGPDLLTKTGLTPTQNSLAWSVSIGLSAADTAGIPVGRWFLQLRLQDTDGSEVTLAVGFFTVLPIRPTP